MKYCFLLSLLFIFCINYAIPAEESFLLIDNVSNERLMECGAVNARVMPCCTFNIFISLIGYDFGVLKDRETPQFVHVQRLISLTESFSVNMLVAHREGVK